MSETVTEISPHGEWSAFFLRQDRCGGRLIAGNHGFVKLFRELALGVAGCVECTRPHPRQAARKSILLVIEPEVHDPIVNNTSIIHLTSSASQPLLLLQCRTNIREEEDCRRCRGDFRVRRAGPAHFIAGHLVTTSSSAGRPRQLSQGHQRKVKDFKRVSHLTIDPYLPV